MTTILENPMPIALSTRYEAMALRGSRAADSLPSHRRHIAAALRAVANLDHATIEYAEGGNRQALDHAIRMAVVLTKALASEEARVMARGGA